MGNLTTSNIGYTSYRDYKGLSTSKAKELLEQNGPNSLPEEKPKSNIIILLEQFRSPLVYILLIAAIITFLLHEKSDTYVILLAVFINTVLGYFQEERAGKALEALKKLLNASALVIRDGSVTSIDSTEIVKGDYVIVRQGDKIPADGKIITLNRLLVSEAILTGESVAVTKEIGNEVFMGTVVSGGEGLFEVTSTGKDTQMGKIAQSVQKNNELTPLAKQLATFSRILSFFILFLTLFVFVLGLIYKRDPLEIFQTSVALAVSAIPEGLLVALTTILAIGMQRILKRKGLVRNLTSAETLGGVTTICTDKTGTLTVGNMYVVDTLGEQNLLVEQVLVANEMADALEIAAASWAEEKTENIKELVSKFSTLDVIPFTSENLYYSSLNSYDESSNVLFVNGAPETILDFCEMDKSARESFLQEIERLTLKGHRVIGYARKYIPAKMRQIDSSMMQDFEWVGLLAFADPVRADVKDALIKTTEAGIKLVVITGDYANTAMAVLQQLGINLENENLLQGTELEKLSDEDLKKWLAKDNSTKLFARTKPQQKLRIVQALKENGEIVAMLGDGVNDAPALSKSDIGVVVNESTDVAKEAADLILLDSSFSTIVAAIEEGRGIFANIRKDILYLLGDSFQMIVAILLSMILKLPLPVTASQILWINIVSDGFPNLALTVEPKDKDIMKIAPRSPREMIVTRWMYELIGVISIVGGVFSFGIFYWVLNVTKDVVLAQSVAFASLGFNPLIYVFSVRTLRKPFWSQKVFGNKWLNFAVILGVIFQVLPFTFVPLREFFGVVNIGYYWGVIVLEAFLILIIVELFKFLLERGAARGRA